MVDDVIKNDIIELDRPNGRKAEKEKIKALDKQIEKNVQHWYVILVLQGCSFSKDHIAPLYIELIKSF